MVLPSKPSELTPPFASMDSPFTAARYHSLVIEEETFPHDALEATAWTEDGLIMAARHKKYKHIQVHQFPNVLCMPLDAYAVLLSPTEDYVLLNSGLVL